MDGHTQLGVWVEDAIKEAMDRVKDAKGIPIVAQVRFGILQWLESQGENPTALKSGKKTK